jgi:hypothetical protein
MIQEPRAKADLIFCLSSNARLTANRVLRIRKVLQYVRGTEVHDDTGAYTNSCCNLVDKRQTSAGSTWPETIRSVAIFSKSR